MEKRFEIWQMNVNQANFSDELKFAIQQYLNDAEGIEEAMPLFPDMITQDVIDYIRDVRASGISAEADDESFRKQREITECFCLPRNDEYQGKTFGQDIDGWHEHIERIAHFIRHDARTRHILLGALEMALLDLEEDVMQGDIHAEEYKIMEEIACNFQGWTDMTWNAMESAEKNS